MLFKCSSHILLVNQRFVPKDQALHCTHAVDRPDSMSLKPFLSFSSNRPPNDHIRQNRYSLKQADQPDQLAAHQL